jgi:hypothetical protein
MIKFSVNLYFDQRMLYKGLPSSKRSLQLSKENIWLSKPVFWANGALQYTNPNPDPNPRIQFEKGSI